jgi:alpha-1,6-mannosyltransferase
MIAVLSFGLDGSLAAALTILGLGFSLVAARRSGAADRPPAVLWPVVAVVAVLAVARCPIGSHDLWSYAFYGRMVSHHGVDPYTAVPASFPHDVVYPVVGWRDTPSGYGPLFTAYSAGVTRLAGESLLIMRLGFQLLAAGAVLWCLRALSRSGQVATLTLVALQPFIWVSVVNGGHNDAIVAAMLLGAALAVRRDRIGVASALTGVATLVKLPAAILAVPVVVVLLVQRRWRAAAVECVGPFLALVASGAVAPGSITNASAATRDRVSRASVWRPVQVVTGLSAPAVTTLALLGVVVLVGCIVWRHRAERDPTRSTGASLAAFGMSASYTLPWYLMWGVPIVALSGDVALTSIVAARGSLMLASYQLGPGPAVQNLASFALSTAAPWVLLVLFVRAALDPPVPDPPAFAAVDPEPDGLMHKGSNR